MAQWAAFAGLTGVVLIALLVLSVLTQRAFEEPNGSSERDEAGGGRALDRSGRGDRDDRDDRDDRNDRSDPLDDSRVRIDQADGTARPRGGSGDDPEAAHVTDQASTDAAAADQASTDAAAADVAESASRQTAGTREPAHSRRGGESGTGTGARIRSESGTRNGTDPRDISTGALLANVALSQGLFAAVLLGAAVYTAIPLEALGIEFDSSYLRSGLLIGAVAGVALYAANEVGAALANRLGVDHDEALRGLLAPDDVRGWVVLLVAVLPVVAFFEEFLFRAALIGVLAAGFDVPIWLLAVGSSVAFAIGHGMQGPAGIVVTGLLGFVLAALFIVTGSLLAVIVAHYLVNALEFVVHEGLGLEPVESVLESITGS
ncbi:CPBP family intramembrane glutamic endopeptidase [Natronosalvus halobius]|uniref:CPBP family intramembrane glutamic endopeptidase n=1 Tax=Natronosalvus halobius TaxID=2953746 RepID=UPI0020A0B213|nr:CPBP family intramembrane glutamic endopeptidase [Natronosalvus halobius]USZ73176.1 CPBP family intramembrane metalloprotease [Natronosalvus halobius]